MLIWTLVLYMIVLLIIYVVYNYNHLLGLILLGIWIGSSILDYCLRGSNGSSSIAKTIFVLIFLAIVLIILFTACTYNHLLGLLLLDIVIVIGILDSCRSENGGSGSSAKTTGLLPGGNSNNV